MKFYIDLATRRFVRGPASSIPLERLFLKRRDKIDVEIVFVEKSAIVPTPTGTSFSTGLKTNFSDTAFLALSDADGLLDLYTTAIEALFADDPASVSAYLEVKTSRPGEETRTSTLGVDIENSVILGDEGLPSSVPSLKATAAEATAGTSNDKWMTPLRTAEAIAALGSASVTWASLPGKPSEFPPASHTHTAAEVSDFAAAVSAVSPPADWGTLTGKPATFPPDSHTHATSEITDFASAVVAVSPPVDWSSLTGKPATFAPSAHTHAIAEVTGLTDALDGKATAAQGALAETALQPEAVDYRGLYDNGADYWPGQVVSYNGELYIRVGEPNPGYPPGTSYWAAFDPSASPAFKLWVDFSKADTIHTHATSEITGLDSALANKQPLGNYATAAQGAKADTASQPGHTHAISEITGLADALAAKMSAFIAKSAVSGGTIYTGRAAPATAESASGWTIRRTVTNSAGSVTNSGTASGAWDQRASLVYA